MSYKLNKPYTEKQRLDFIVEYNHNQGLKIEEVNNALYALEPWEKLIDNEVIDNTEEYEVEQAQKERERIDMLSLTPSDVERILYKAKKMDFDDLKALIAKKIPNIDLKGLAIEFRAKDFWRGATLEDGTRIFDVVGALLGFTPEDMNYLFENKELPEKVVEPEPEKTTEETNGADEIATDNIEESEEL